MDPDVVDPEPLLMPSSAEEWPGWLRDRARDDLASAGAGVTAIKEVPAGDRVVLTLWNDVQLALLNALFLPALICEVHPDPAVVTLGEELEREARQLAADLLLDADVYAALAAVDSEALEPASRRVLDLALRDFRRGGIALDETAGARLRDLNRRIGEVTQDFTRHIREGERITRVPVGALEGLPEDYLAEHQPDVEGLVAVSTAYPDTIPFLTLSRDAQARRAVAHSAGNLGWPENDETLAELLRLREDKAHLLGYADWPSYDAEERMIGSGERIAAFIEQLTEAAETAGRREREVLLESARAAGEDDIDTSNVRFHTEAVKRERYGVDSQEVRRYFPTERVVDGVLDVMGRLLGLEFRPVDVPTWHEDVTSYDVALVDNGQRLGRVHLDLHPRTNKYNHAAQFGMVPGIRGRQLGESALVCNFSRTSMTHADVVTFFHELGHLVHFVVAGRHDWARFSGIANEWDFTEAPSQLLERWAWDAEVLAEFARDEDGISIPAELVARMRAADEFGKAFHVRTQMGYAAVSYWLHQERPADLTSATLALTRSHSLIEPLPDTHFHAGFGHLEGYTSGYYTYMWSLVIAKDLLSAFDPDDLFAPEVAHRYRDTVLAPGGSADAADLVERFLGRPYDDRAFREWLDSSADPEPA